MNSIKDLISQASANTPIVTLIDKLSIRSLSCISVLNVIQFGIFLYCILYYPFSFNSDFQIENQYNIISFSLFIAICCCLYYFYNGKKIIKTFSYHNVITILLFDLILIRFITYPSIYNLSNEYLVVLVVLISALTLFNQTSFKVIKLFWVGIIAVYCLELLLYLKQLISFYEESSIFFKVTGTLKYSAIFTCYCVVQIPVFRFFLNNNFTSKRLKTLLFSLILTLNSSLIYFTRSRTALIAFTFILCMLYYSFFCNYLTKLYRYFKLFLIPILVISILGISYHFYLIKKFSAIGRIVMWRISFEHLTDNLWFGVGLGKLPLYYPGWQAAYFNRFADYSSDFFLVAGETYLIYNEFLQLFLEAGIVGGIVVSLILIDFFKSTSEFNKDLLKAVKITVGSILITGITDNSFHMIPIMFILILSFATCYKIRDNNTFFIKGSLMGVVYSVMTGLLIISLVIMLITAIKETSTVWNLNRITKDYRISSGRLNNEFEDAYPILKHNGKFLQKYGRLLLEQNRTNEAITKFEKSKKWIITYEGLESIANAYKMKGDYYKSILHYKFISDFVPSQFRPRYELVKLYANIGDIENAKNEANKILLMPVKKESHAVEIIREEMKEFLKTQNIR